MSGGTGDKRKSAGNAGLLWADLTLMQDLEEKMNSSGSIMDSGKKFERGSESYALPDGANFPNDEEKEKDAAIEADDKDEANEHGFFGDGAGDEMADVESFGVQRSSRNARKRRRERSPAAAKRHFERKFKYTSAQRPGLVTVCGDCRVVDESNGANSSTARTILHTRRRDMDGESYEKRGRATRRHNNNGGDASGSSKQISTSMTNIAESTKHSDGAKGGGGYSKGKAARMKGLLAKNYTTEKLFNADFPADSSLAELGRLMADALGERAQDVIQDAVEAIGKEKSLDVFNETKVAEKAGGMMTRDGRRRRTPGGVFLFLVKQLQGGSGAPSPDPTTNAEEKCTSLNDVTANAVNATLPSNDGDNVTMCE